jgi:ribonuclease HIII
VPSEDRREQLRQLIIDAGAEESKPTNQYEVWRYHLQRGNSRAQIILYSSHRCTLPAGHAPAYDVLWACITKAMSGLGGLEEMAQDPADPPKQPTRARTPIDESEPHIGTDEAGKGDFFGPLVSAAVFVDARTANALRALGVKDSKLLSDKAVRSLAEQIRRVTGANSKVTPIPPKRFNDLYAQMKGEGKNLNTLLAWGHTRSIEDLIRLGLKPNFAIVDQFADARYIERRLLQDTRDSGISILQFPKAESDIAVAAASILARDAFLDWMDRQSQQLGLKLPKGASQQVIDTARQLVARLGPDALRDFAKISFRTTEKVLAP